MSERDPHVEIVVHLRQAKDGQIEGGLARVGSAKSVSFDGWLEFLRLIEQAAIAAPPDED